MSNSSNDNSKRKLPNVDKTWKDIMQEIDRDSVMLWNYVTILRGPDIDNSSIALAVRLVLTCPLRARCERGAGVGDFLALNTKDVEDCLKLICTHKDKLFHYLGHVVAVWNSFCLPIGELLTEVFYYRGCTGLELESIAKRYVKLVVRWLRSTDVVVRCFKHSHREKVLKL